MFRKSISFLVSGFILASVFSCNNDTVPKPASHLRLEYPKARYVGFENNCPFSFEMNDDAIISDKGNCNFTISYPKMKATIYLTYKPVKNDIDAHLRDAQKLTYGHTVKADDITEQPFLNKDNKVYGMFYKVGGNAATNALFYATDSTRHFVTGSVYFYAKPNFDSIMPASSYVKNDMQVIMETLRWK
ncbi:gliding motility lipoprotein GldD [Flavobacterium qiangtangense]|uniref:Gliding motility lipoprotein GldD n=1 Tax=Flavobacterium qiangtangense TaxID=1442595 RepID=A0ABW1PNM8_9FLAO